VIGLALVSYRAVDHHARLIRSASAAISTSRRGLGVVRRSRAVGIGLIALAAVWSRAACCTSPAINTFRRGERAGHVAARRTAFAIGVGKRHRRVWINTRGKRLPRGLRARTGLMLAG